jgi:glucose-1-phosphate cytidylyltransferase
MQSIILAGGYGTRFSEYTQTIPKPLIEIGNLPILMHIIKIYQTWDINDIIVCLGYKGDIIQNYFNEIKDISNKKNCGLHGKLNLTLFDTGLETMTGGRVLRCKKFINDTFSVTYGDSLLDINISELVKFHNSHNKIATITAIQKKSSFHLMELDGNQVNSLYQEGEKNCNWTNGGFFIFEPEIFDYIDDDKTLLENETLKKLAEDSQLMAFKHYGFWHPMDTLQDKKKLDRLCSEDKAPWKVWDV